MDIVVGILIVIVICCFVSSSLGVGVYQSTMSATPPTAPTPSPVIECASNGFWAKTKAGSVAEASCENLGQIFTGGSARRMCDAQGTWKDIDFSACIGGGVKTKMDISGKWKFGNGGYIDIEFNDLTNKGKIIKVTTPPNVVHGVQSWDGSGIKYKENIGYIVDNKDVLVFTNESKNVLTDGSLKLTKATEPLNSIPASPEPEGCVCSSSYEPVCASNGTTYSNACKAQCANATVVSQGECGSGGPSPVPA